jgi:Cupin superfamily protein
VAGDVEKAFGGPRGDEMCATSLGFHDLIAPMTEAEFSELRSSRAIALRRRTSGDRIGESLDWDVLRSLVGSSIIPATKWRLTYGGRDVPRLLYSENGRPDAARLAQLCEQGGSLIVLALQEYVPAFGAVCRDAAERGLRVINVDAIATSGRGGALGLHFDPEDNIVRQLEGSKRWRIFGPPAAIPAGDDPAPSPPQNEPLFDEALQPGDFLFVPAGYWHQCENGSDRSLHVGFLFDPPAAAN